MRQKKPLFDTAKAKAIIGKGRRAKWWRRKGSTKRGFYYTDADGKRISDDEQLERVRSIVIPPAWKYVRICPSAGGRLQAVGMDTNGRVQYLYHPKFAARRQRMKFSKIENFGKYLPRLRRATNEDITLDGFPREKVLAIMMRLINSLYFRVGTDKSAKHYRTYGITTLQNKHLRLGSNGELVFEFDGKSHVHHRKVLVDDELASVMKELKELGGTRKLFHYLNGDGKPRPVKPKELNDYLKSVTSPEFSSKDLRTWGATIMAAVKLAEMEKTDDETILKKNVVAALKDVAEYLGNTPAVCRDSYIHPTVIKCYESGITLDQYRPRGQRRIKRVQSEYEPEEAALLKLFAEHSRL